MVDENPELKSTWGQRGTVAGSAALSALLLFQGVSHSQSIVATSLAMVAGYVFAGACLRASGPSTLLPLWLWFVVTGQVIVAANVALQQMQQRDCNTLMQVDMHLSVSDPKCLVAMKGGASCFAHCGVRRLAVLHRASPTACASSIIARSCAMQHAKLHVRRTRRILDTQIRDLTMHVAMQTLAQACTTGQSTTMAVQTRLS